MSAGQALTFIAIAESLTGGKSAVLTAIIVALGGRSNVTGRGTGVKEFIRQGAE